MASKPTNQLGQRVSYVNNDGTLTPEFIRQWNLQRTSNTDTSGLITALQAEVDALLALKILAVTPLIGGGVLGAGKDISLGLTPITPTLAPGPWGDATHVPQITVDVFGRVTSVVNVAITGGGGGGASPFWATAPTPPVSATFTLIKGGGTTASLTDLTRGVLMQTLGAGAVDRNALAEVVTPGATWVMTALLMPNVTGRQFSGWGLYARDSGSGKIQAFFLGVVAGITAGAGQFGPVFRDTHWSAIDTFAASGGELDNAFPYSGPIWLQLRLTATNFETWISRDGETYTFVYSVAKGTYLPAITNCGVFFGTNQQSAPQNITESMLVMSFSCV